MMSVISIQRTHQLTLNELKDKINQLIVSIEEKLEVHPEWESAYYLSFRRKGANGFIEFDDSRFELTIRLGLMFRMLKGTIENQVVSMVDSHLK